MMVSRATGYQEESGQALVIAAAVLFTLVVVILFSFRVQRLYNVANFMEETVAFAADAAAQPEATSLRDGDLEVDESLVDQRVQAAVKHAVTQINIISMTEAEIVSNTSAQAYRREDEVLLSRTGCDKSVDPDADPEDDCFWVPGVVVTMTLDIDFLGWPVSLTRTGTATLGTQQGVVEELPTPTPIVFEGGGVVVPGP